MTLGQKRVKADFNPAKNETVDQIKNKAAELIDLCESLRVVGSAGERFYSEKNRLISAGAPRSFPRCRLLVR